MDGRRARRGRNREAVVDALLELFHEGQLDPSVATVAERSGVSLRSVFRYFDDLEEMSRMAIQRHFDAVHHLFEIPAIGEGSRGQRVAALVNQRITLFEQVAPVVRAAQLRAPFQPVLEEALRRRRTFLRRQIERQFAPELAALPPAEKFAVVRGADLLTSIEAVEMLRGRQKLSVAKTIAVMTASLDRLLPMAG